MFTLESNKKTWNDLVIKHGGSLLQSWEWGDLQKNLGCGVERYVFKTSSTDPPELIASVLTRPIPLGFTYTYVPYGPLVIHPDTKTTLQRFLRELTEVAKKEKAIFLRLEPRGTAKGDLSPAILTELGFRETPPFQPRHTSIIDLKKPEAKIVAAMEPETRYALRAAERRGVKIVFEETPGPIFEAFSNLLAESAERKKFSNHPRRYYENLFAGRGDLRALVVAAEAEGIVIAAALIVFFGPTASYLYAASKPGFGKLNAPSLILWEAIREAKRRGCTTFDLWGISDENKKWAGFTAFKRSFGGTEKSYLGTWDFPLNKPMYHLFTLAKHIKRAL